MNCFESHPSLDSLELYLLDRLDASEKEELADHMLICSACRQMSDALEHEIQLLREALLKEDFTAA